MGSRNLEFLLYIGVLLIVSFSAFFVGIKNKVPLFVLWMLSIWGLLHLAGGWVVVSSDVLYNYVPWHAFSVQGEPVFKFDQIIHMYGFGTTALFIWYLLRPRMSGRISVPIFSIFCAIGFGALNEVVEFLAVVLIANTNVGGYVNTGLDLVFNLAGAALFVLVAEIVSRKQL